VTTTIGNQEHRMTATREGSVIVGVDTHKHVHVAVALNGNGERLGDVMIAAERAGYEQLLAWARALGHVNRFGIEGSGSYGQGLVSYLRRHDQQVLEAGRPDRRDRRQRGKSDTLDAENAARAVLAGTATATPRRSEGTSEMLRQVKVARDTAVKARTSAIIALKALIVTAPDELRSELQPLTKAVLRDRGAGLRPGAVTTPLAAAKRSLERSRAAGSSSTRRSPITTRSSRSSLLPLRPRCARRSGSGPTQRPRC
jgi:transposase